MSWRRGSAIALPGATDLALPGVATPASYAEQRPNTRSSRTAAYPPAAAGQGWLCSGRMRYLCGGKCDPPAAPLPERVKHRMASHGQGQSKRRRPWDCAAWRHRTCRRAVLGPRRPGRCDRSCSRARPGAAGVPRRAGRGATAQQTAQYARRAWRSRGPARRRVRREWLQRRCPQPGRAGEDGRLGNGGTDHLLLGLSHASHNVRNSGLLGGQLPGSAQRCIHCRPRPTAWRLQPWTPV